MLYPRLAVLAVTIAAATPALAADTETAARPEAAQQTAPSTSTGHPSSTGETAASAGKSEGPSVSLPPTGTPSAENSAPQAAAKDTVTTTTSTAEKAASTPPATQAANDPDPTPSEPDPLTPPTVDTGPARAPGAPTRPDTARTTSEIDPFIASVRTRLDRWSAARGEAAANDLAALKAYYAENDAERLWTTSDGLSQRAEAAIKALERADEWGLDAAAFDLPPPPRTGALPETLIEAEIRVGLEVLKYARHARGGRLDPPSISKMIDMRPRLYEPRSILEAIAKAPAADTYLEDLNPRHPGFVALKAALSKLRSSETTAANSAAGEKKTSRASSADERRIIVNMERWRWLPADLGAFYVWDNVPEQITRVYHDGKEVHHARIVVGKPSTPTPIFSAPMRFVIFHPSWGVPEGIKSKELGPMLRRAQANSSGWFFSDNEGASRVLRRHQLRVFIGGREINPDSVNWASTDVRRFTFTQPPSRSNVLGVVKFRFPNKFDVYMHDTSERHLFSRAPRTFSHGCMRVENPLKLAETILAYDRGWGKERIAQLAARGSTTDVTLEKPVPVHIVYFTATADADGKLHTFRDIYGLDSRVASALAGRSVVLSSAHTSEDDVKPTTTHRTPRARAARRAETSAPKPAAPRNWRAFPTGTGN
ncbi:MAG: L,D-transpeptidase family protein [Hyphomicrobiaceae bacterium]